MKINEVAKLTSVTVRTLHYYDEIGLLKPSEVTEAGYRVYNDENLERLQQILFFRELDFSLSDIKEIMNNPNFDKTQALAKHKELLIKKRQRLDRLIELVDTTLQGEYDMSFKQFDMKDIETAKKNYKAEVEERWGHTEAYKECERKTASYDKEKWEFLNEEGTAILAQFGQLRTSDPSSDEAQELVKRWQSYLTQNFYQCTLEILAGLGLMYVADERFKRNIDKNGEGTAEFMSKAIEEFCKDI